MVRPISSCTGRLLLCTHGESDGTAVVEEEGKARPDGAREEVRPAKVAAEP